MVSLASIAAVPGLAAVLLGDLGAPPIAAVGVLLAPGLLFSSQHVYADPLLIALLLGACVLDGRGRHGRALAVIAAAILVKEVAVLALVPWVWRALKQRDRTALVRAAGALAALCRLVPSGSACGSANSRSSHTRIRARARSRFRSWGCARAISAHTPGVAGMVAMTAVTVALGAVAARLGRGTRIGDLAGVYTVLTVCLGMNTIAYPLECERVMAVAEVFALLCIAVEVTAQRRPQPAFGRPELPVPVAAGRD